MQIKKINLTKIYRYGIYRTLRWLAKKYLNKYPLTNVKGYDQTTTLGRIDLCPILQGQILLHLVADLQGTL